MERSGPLTRATRLSQVPARVHRQRGPRSRFGLVASELAERCFSVPVGESARGRILVRRQAIPQGGAARAGQRRSARDLRSEVTEREPVTREVALWRCDRGGSVGPVVRSQAACGPRDAAGHQGLAAAEAGFEPCKNQHLRLAVLPAEINDAAVHERGEINQTLGTALGLDAQLPQLFDVGLQPLAIFFQLFFDLLELFGIEIAMVLLLLPAASEQGQSLAAIDHFADRATRSVVMARTSGNAAFAWSTVNNLAGRFSGRCHVTHSLAVVAGRDGFWGISRQREAPRGPLDRLSLGAFERVRPTRHGLLADFA